MCVYVRPFSETLRGGSHKIHCTTLHNPESVGTSHGTGSLPLQISQQHSFGIHSVKNENATLFLHLILIKISPLPFFMVGWGL